jgi:hypothetical protein
MGEISEMIDRKLEHQAHGRVHHHRSSSAGASRSYSDHKRQKIDKKLQKLQTLTQKMSLDMEDVTHPRQKIKSERKLGKINKRMEKLEVKLAKVSSRRSHSDSLASEEPMESETPLAEEGVDKRQVLQTAEDLTEPLVEIRAPSQYDACILSNDGPVLHVDVGSTFTKTWLIKNVGELPWTEKVFIISDLHKATE